MMYLVVVNQKYIVSVEANSNGGAEHRVLDAFDGIWTAQAFMMSELGTDTFKHYAETCETISMSELEAKCNGYKRAWEIVGEKNDAVYRCKLRIKEAEKALEDLKEELEMKQAQLDLYIGLAEDVNKSIGFKKSF